MQIPDSSEFTGPSRRDVVLLGIGAFAVATVPFLRSGRPRLVQRSVPVMGTIADIGVVHRDQAYAQAAIDAAIRQLRYVDRTMTAFSESSDVGRANSMATGAATVITSATASVITEGLRWAEASDGAFDPCIGRAVNLWDVKNRTAPPEGAQVRRLAGHALYRTLDLGMHGGRRVVQMTDASAAIDLGGIAKGYAVDLAVRSLREWGIEHALVNAGGDLYAMGESQDGDPWSVGVRSPYDPSQISHRFELADAAVATSGDYLQNFRHGGMLYHHLLDPATAAPRRTDVHSVTVTASSCMAADAAATTVFGMQRDRAERILKSTAPEATVVTTL
ncbi:MAG: FAD:protein FMN transferase [Gemmatimonadota bacterium]|nr:MAG: FAD:protein FMN transferase [Gemmatimonadota bacterium]